MRPTLRSILSKLAVVLASLVVSAGMLEVMIRVYLLNHTVYDIEMTRYAQLMKTESPNPRIGHIHEPNRSATLMNVPVRINSDGFRDREHAVAHGDAYRIIFLGDSFTFGWGVDEAQTFKTLLESALSERTPTEIINFGIGNYNSEQEVNLFLDKGLKYAPDKVVVFYFINDAEPTQRKSPYAFIYHSRFVAFAWSRLHALFTDLNDRGYHKYYADLYRGEQPGWTNAQHALLQLKDVCDQHGIALQVVLIPDLHALRDYPFAQEHALITTFLREHGIQVLDLAPLFKDQPDPKRLWVADDDAHANALGHRLIAEYARDFVAQRGIGDHPPPGAP